MRTLVSLIAITGYLLTFTSLQSQSFTATVVDAKTQAPIPYATIQTGEHKGTITNEEGMFSLTERELRTLKDSIYVSAMGYDKIGVLVSESTETILSLMPSTFILDEVLLTNTNYTAEEIIDKVKEHLTDNYYASSHQWKFFFRQSDHDTKEQMNIKVKESTIAELDQSLMNQLAASIPQRTSRYRETAGTLYGDSFNYKLQISKAADLYDASKSISMDAITDKMERIFKENVKPDSYLKIRTGIIGAKVELDDEEENEPIVKKEDTLKDNNVYTAHVRSNLNNLMEQLFFNEGTELDILDKSNRYRWTLEGYAVQNEAPVYKLRYTPRGGKDFEGLVYVNMDDFAIVRLEFNNVKPTNRFGMFGITYRRNVLRGKMLFVKEAEGGYRPQYLELEDGELVGVDRPLTVIEKNKHVKGRRKQNELDLDLVLKINTLTKYELVIFESEFLPKDDFNAFTEIKKIPSTTLKAYDPDFWQGYTIMAPNEAIREFTISEQ